MPVLRFADVIELHSQLDRNPANFQTWWWTQHRCKCICMCMYVHYQHPSLLGGLEMGVSPAWWLYQWNQRDQALRAGEMAARYEKLKTHSVRQSVSLSHFRASHHRRYQQITTGTLKACTAPSKAIVQCVSYSYYAVLNYPFFSHLEKPLC